MIHNDPIRVAIDLETTGLELENDSIIEIGAVKFRGQEILDTFSTFIETRRSIPYRIQRLTGIQLSMLKGAPPIASVVPGLRNFLNDFPLVGHSVNFDVSFLRKFHVAERNATLDTFDLASLLLPKLQNYSLDMVAKDLHIPTDIRHRALADAELARAVFLALEERIQFLPDPLLNQICETITPAIVPSIVLLNRVQHDRGIQPSAHAKAGTVGAVFNATLGFDPAVLGMRIAALGSPQAEALPAQEPQEQILSHSADDQAATFVRASLSESAVSMIETASDQQNFDAIVLPAIEWAQREKKRIVIATARAAAVKQMMVNILPRVMAKLSPENRTITVAPLYETKEYICLHRWFGISRESATITPDSARGFAKIAMWLNETETGHQGEITINATERTMWDLASAGEEHVQVKQCPYRDRGWCFAQRARQRAQDADVIITTHATLFAGQKENAILHQVDGYIVVDAHHLEERLVSMETRTGDIQLLYDLLALLGQEREKAQATGLLPRAKMHLVKHESEQWPQFIKKARESILNFFTSLDELVHDYYAQNANKNENAQVSIRLDSTTQALPAWGMVQENWHQAEKRLNIVIDVLKNTAKALEKVRGTESLRLEMVTRSAEVYEKKHWLGEVIEHPCDGIVYWLKSGGKAPRTQNAAQANAKQEQTGEDLPVLQSAPPYIGEMITPLLALRKSVLFVGNPLRVDEKFHFLQERLGIPPQSQTLSLPEDCSQQTLFCIPSDATEPNVPAYQQSLNAAILSVATALQGRTVVLFSSYTAIRTTYTALKAQLEKQNILVLAQGIDGSQRQLWQVFRSQERVILFSAGSVWDGWETDLAPPCIFIARLPLSTLHDPILSARSGIYSDPMQQYLVPHAALRLRQTLNRLAWTAPQRNAIILFDRRIITKNYGAVMANTLPPTHQIEVQLRDLGATVREWIEHAT